MSSEFFRYVIVWTTSFFLNTITHDYLLSTFNNYLPFIISAIISVLINFSGAKFWVFKK